MPIAFYILLAVAVLATSPLTKTVAMLIMFAIDRYNVAQTNKVFDDLTKKLKSIPGPTLSPAPTRPIARVRDADGTWRGA